MTLMHRAIHYSSSLNVMKSSQHSLINTKCFSITKNARLIRVIHTSIRPQRRIHSENNKSIYCNPSQLQKNVWEHTNSIEQPTPDLLNDFSTQSKQKFSIKLKDNYRSSSETKANLSKISRSWSDRKGTTEDLWEKSKKNRKRKCYCCRCSYLCIFMSLCSALLLAISITAILVGLLTRTSNSSTTLKGITLLVGTNEIVYGLWNTTVGGSSTLPTPGSSIGNYNPTETPQNVFDQNSTTKYTSYGICNQSAISILECGVHTGLYLTLQRGASLLTGIRFCTANSLPERDPMTITVEGSNQPSSALLLGSSWTLIYNGSSGLDSDPGRYSLGVTEIISNNIVWYNSYRLLITSKRNISNAVQYSEVELLGY